MTTVAARQVEVVGRQAQHLAARGISAGHGEQVAIRTERGLHQTVLEPGDLVPSPLGRSHEEGELAAVAVLDGGQQSSGRRIGLEPELGDPRQVLAQLIPVG